MTGRDDPIGLTTGSDDTITTTAYLTSAQAAMALIDSTPIGTLNSQIWDGLCADTRIQIYDRGGDGDDSFESATLDEDEQYDSPGEEEDLETGEGVPTIPPGIDPVEDWFSYAYRRLQEDFGDALEPAEMERLEEITERIAQADPIPDDLPQPIRQWFIRLLKENPMESRIVPDKMEQQAEIVFFFSDGKLDFDLDFGNLDRLSQKQRFDPVVLLTGGYCRLSWLIRSLERRRTIFQLLAQFLMERQETFLRATNLPQALTLRKVLSQQSFLQYLESHGENVDQANASRMIQGKLFLTPFSRRSLPLSLFFSNQSDAIALLKRAIDLHVIQNKKRPFSSAQQVFLLERLGIGSFSTQQLRQTLWKALQSIYPGSEDQWYGLGIIGRRGKPPKGHFASEAQMVALMNQLIHDLHLAVEPVRVGED